MGLLFFVTVVAVVFGDASLASVSVPVDLRTILRRVDNIFYTESHFVVKFAVGTPAQKFSAGISLDTATSFVSDRTCIYHPKACPNYCFAKGALCKFICRSDCCGPNARPPTEPTCGDVGLSDCGTRKKFDNETSTTYKLDGSWFCDEGHFAFQAFTGIDTLQVGTSKGADLSIPSSMFGQIWQQDIDVQIPIDGVFGLAPALAAPKNYVPPLLNAFKRGLIAEPTVTLWLNKTATPEVDDHKAPGFGMLTIGGPDKTRCGALGPFIGMYRPAAYRGVRLEIKSISLGTKTIAPGRSGSNNLPWVLGFGLVQENLGWAPEPQTSLRGTGMGELAVAAGAKYDQAADVYRIACDARQPALQLNFVGGSVEIPFSAFVSQTTGGCILNFVEDDCNEHSCPFVAYLTMSYCLTVDVAKNSLAFSANIAP